MNRPVVITDINGGDILMIVPYDNIVIAELKATVYKNKSWLRITPITDLLPRKKCETVRYWIDTIRKLQNPKTYRSTKYYTANAIPPDIIKFAEESVDRLAIARLTINPIDKFDIPRTRENVQWISEHPEMSRFIRLGVANGNCEI